MCNLLHRNPRVIFTSKQGEVQFILAREESAIKCFGAFEKLGFENKLRENCLRGMDQKLLGIALP